MPRAALKYLRLLAPLTVAAALGVGSLPAFAQTATTSPSDCSAIHFDLANPTPGSRVEQGGLSIQGVAVDSRARQGPGVDRVAFFLDNRDDGGLPLGSAVPGMVNDLPGMPGLFPSPMGSAGFETTVTLPNELGGHSLFAYAHSTVTGQESIIQVPFALGEDPSVAGVSPTATELLSCSTGAGATAPVAVGATTQTMPVATPQPNAPTGPASATSTTPGATTLTFSVGNPSPGDTVKAGGLTVQGVAFDRATLQGSGVTRVDIFLDNRDNGGMALGQAVPGDGNVWQATVILPNNQLGQHTLSFAAHAVSGAESDVAIPITIAP
jgi:hypothetical protein